MKRIVLGLALITLIGLSAIVAAYLTIPTRTAGATHFDALIVLGYPSNSDGSASPEQRERVLEAVRELKAGRAAHMIVTGAAAHNQWIEAETMARTAEQEGVAAEAIVVEPRAQNTIENLFYSDRIMQQRGWISAEVISSPSHLPRASLILQHHRFAWTTHAAPWPQSYSSIRIAAAYVVEALKTSYLRWFGFAKTPFLP